ncbi:metallophosphoesterase, partial [Candidatus Dependentiae bacterium]|nr:metallophosphoesterase [Candidatus Dependentiae bacterium]
MNRKFFLTIALLIILTLFSFSKDNYHFVVLGDRLGGVDQEAFEMVLRDIERLKPDFVVTVGDMAEAYAGAEFLLKDWAVVNESLKIISCPIYHTAGNHDIRDEETRKIYEEKSGFKSYYSFDHGETHFLILDNAIPESFEDMDKEQVKWLEDDLKKNMHRENIYVFIHKPFWAHGVGKGKPDKMHELFLKYNVDAVFTGHWHQYASNIYDGILYTLVGSSGGHFGSKNKENISLGMFYQFLWCKVDGDKLHTALIKSGNIFDRDLVTIEEEMLSYEIGSKHISSEMIFIEGESKSQYTVNVRIKNIDKNKIEEKIIWNPGKNWEVTPSEKIVKIKPGKTANEKFSFKQTGELYPLPEMQFKYTFGNKKYIEYENSVILQRQVSVPKVIIKPVIDGKVNEPGWRTAIISGNFCSYYGDKSKIDDTKIYFQYDNKNLYFAAVCYDKKMKSISDKLKKRDDKIYNDDCIG